PRYEPGTYTFIADYLPFGTDDAMEHRNSAVLTSDSNIATRRADFLESVAHEFFHSWNVERIRPRSLEPFALERMNPSREVGMAGGFTQYYGPLVLARAGIQDVTGLASTMTGLIDGLLTSPARSVHSLEQISLMAPFIDGSRPIDRTNWSTTILSYYP